MILNERAQFELAAGLRRGTANIGELFTFVSGLYFRGKMAYATAFAAPPHRLPATLVITPNRGLLPPDTLITLDEFRAMAEVPIDIAERRYRERMRRVVRVDVVRGLAVDEQRVRDHALRPGEVWIA